VGAQLVAEGLAWAFVRYSDDDADLEASARKIGTGIWQADTQPPWDFRANRWEHAAAEAPDGCHVKGNVNRAGERIYQNTRQNSAKPKESCSVIATTPDVT
jgi:hypothetical protein